MIRAYALGLGAGTQVLTHLPWMAMGGEIDQTARTIAVGAGWGINAIVAEWIIRGRPLPWRAEVRWPRATFQKPLPVLLTLANPNRR